MAVGYCPKCNQNVQLTKHDIDVCLLCLLFFTGIGWIIYLIIYALEPDDRCVFCGTKVRPPLPQSAEASRNSVPPTYPLVSPVEEAQSPAQTQSVKQTVYASPQQTIKPVNSTTVVSNSPPLKSTKFCPYCGGEINANSKFCGLCGSQIDTR